jgi:hypothetical protein
MKSIDWPRIAGELDSQGNAVVPRLLTAANCRALSGLYEDDARFRSRVIMARMAMVAANTAISPILCRP